MATHYFLTYLGAIATVSAATIAALPGFLNTLHGNKSDLVKNAEMAKKLAKSLKEQDHKIVIETQFSAMANKIQASYKEILLLISFESPIYAIYYYRYSKKLIKFENNMFVQKNKGGILNKIRLKLLFALFWICLIIAAVYLIRGLSFSGAGEMVLINKIAFTFIFPSAFVILGLFSLIQRRALSCAVKLIEMQNLILSPTK